MIKPYYEQDGIVLHLGDCLQVLKELPDNSVDSIVTDPPYGISFMGKKWDYNVPSIEIWTECLRVLKPGGHALVACGTRTQHRMAVNLEDAGFEIRDIVAWIYGSGFPKSHNIGKAVDKLQGNERDIVGTKADLARDGAKRKPENHDVDGTQNLHIKTNWDAAITKGSSPYEGYGTALKPAMELWTLCRKPFKGTVAENVLKWGTGGLNIDGCRVETNEDTSRKVLQTQSCLNASKAGVGTVTDDWKKGRFPANVIHDGSDEVTGLFPQSNGASSQNNYSNGKIYRGQSLLESESRLDGYRDWYNDNGSASRFFYTAKASKSERNRGLEGFEEKQKIFNGQSDKHSTDIKDVEKRFTTQPSANNHPTVKPIALMKYLCKLITPTKGICLDPFMGSGSTGVACKEEGFGFIGIERDLDYFKIAEARITATIRQSEMRLEI